MDTRAWLTEEWSTRLAAVIETMTEFRPRPAITSTVTADILSAANDWQRIPLTLAPDAALLVGADELTWLALGTFALKAAGVDTVSRQDALSTSLELLTQSCSSVAPAIGGRVGREVTCQAPVATAAPLGACAGIEFSLPDGVPIRILFAPTAEVEQAIAQAAQLATASQPAAADTTSSSETAALTQRSKTIDLLLEVELPVSVSFGRAQLALRDVMKLNSGSIVELNRTINEPVEIIVNNCVIARGEVVVVDGNYGVRIQHVVSREERLRTLT